MVFQACIEIKLCGVLLVLKWAWACLQDAWGSDRLRGVGDGRAPVPRQGQGVSAIGGVREKALELRFHLTFPGERDVGFLMPWG